MEVTTAVFPVAGYGTRFLPATKAMPKELLPLVDTPLIQLAVQEAAEAGIKKFVFVTGRNKRSIEDHFDRNFELEHKLNQSQDFDKLARLRETIPSGCSCIFVRQSEQLGLGHAVGCAEVAVGDNPFAVILADEVISLKTENVTAEMCKQFNVSGKSQVAGMEVVDKSIERYGVFEFDSTGDKVTGLVEKPNFSTAPSKTAVIGRYVLSAEVFELLKYTKVGANSEIQLTDALNTLAKNDKLDKYSIKGIRHDCGDKQGYIDAFVERATQLGFRVRGEN